jgi:hypothetical protein
VADVDGVDRELESIDHELIERRAGLSYANPIRLNAKFAALRAMVRLRRRRSHTPGLRSVRGPIGASGPRVGSTPASDVW